MALAIGELGFLSPQGLRGSLSPRSTERAHGQLKGLVSADSNSQLRALLDPSRVVEIVRSFQYTFLGPAGALSLCRFGWGRTRWLWVSSLIAAASWCQPRRLPDGTHRRNTACCPGRPSSRESWYWQRERRQGPFSHVSRDHRRPRGRRKMRGVYSII